MLVGWMTILSHPALQLCLHICDQSQFVTVYNILT
jgi:hypothetical protein